MDSRSSPHRPGFAVLILVFASARDRRGSPVRSHVNDYVGTAQCAEHRDRWGLRGWTRYTHKEVLRAALEGTGQCHKHQEGKVESSCCPGRSYDLLRDHREVYSVSSEKVPERNLNVGGMQQWDKSSLLRNAGSSCFQNSLASFLHPMAVSSNTAYAVSKTELPSQHCS